MKLVQLINGRDYFFTQIKEKTSGFFKDCFRGINLQLVFTSSSLNFNSLFVSITNSAQTLEPGLFKWLFYSVKWSVISKYIFWGKEILKSKSKLCSFTKREGERGFIPFCRGPFLLLENIFIFLEKQDSACLRIKGIIILLT